MPAPKSSSSSGGSNGSKRGTAKRSSGGGAKKAAAAAGSGAAKTAKAARSGAKGTATAARAGSKRTATQAKSAATKTARAAGVPEAATSFGEQLTNRILNPLDLVMITRERIQDTLDEAAERGRVTRDDANELVAELFRRGRSQTDDVLADIEDLLDRGRSQLETATKRARRTEPVDRLVRTADQARRKVGVGPAFPILGYDDLTAGQVDDRLGGLSPAQLRKVRDYERRHANRKSVLAAIERELG